MTDRPLAPQSLPFVLSLSASCELPQKDSEHSCRVWYVLASLPRLLQNVLPLVQSNQSIPDDGSAMPPRQVRAWSVLLLQILLWVSQINQLGMERLCEAGESRGCWCLHVPHRGDKMAPGPGRVWCQHPRPPHLRHEATTHHSWI